MCSTSCLFFACFSNFGFPLTRSPSSSQARVEEKLNQLIAELRAGKREGSVVTTDSINSLSTEDKETWRQLRRELEDIGIAVAVIKQHQHFIVSWLENAVRTGAIEDLADDREAIVHVTLDNGDEGEPLTPDLDLERPFDARTSTRSGSDALTTTSGTLQAHQTVDSATNRRSEVNIPRHILFWHRMNRVLAIAPKGFFDAVREGDLKRVEELLSDPGLNINCRDNEKSTALHLAAWRGNSILAKIILDKGAKIEAKDSGGQTALHCAAIRGHLGLVKLLLANGADIEASTDVGTTALSEAAYRDHSEVVALLLKMGGDVENCGYSKRTALHYAAWTGRATVIEILLKKGAAIEARTKVGFTALLIAASHGHLKAVEMLLNQGANANAKTNNGETALLIASLRGSTNLVKLLLSGRKVNVDVKTHDGRTALYIAASNNHRGIVELLVRKGAFVDAKSVQRAIRRADVDILKLLLKGGKETLVDAKSVGRAIRRGDVDIWKLLLNGGTGVNTSNDNRRTPLDK